MLPHRRRRRPGAPTSPAAPRSPLRRDGGLLRLRRLRRAVDDESDGLGPGEPRQRARRRGRRAALAPGPATRPDADRHIRQFPLGRWPRHRLALDPFGRLVGDRPVPHPSGRYPPGKGGVARLRPRGAGDVHPHERRHLPADHRATAVRRLDHAGTRAGVPVDRRPRLSPHDALPAGSTQGLVGDPVSRRPAVPVVEGRRGRDHDAARRPSGGGRGRPGVTGNERAVVRRRSTRTGPSRAGQGGGHLFRVRHRGHGAQRGRSRSGRAVLAVSRSLHRSRSLPGRRHPRPRAELGGFSPSTMFELGLAAAIEDVA